MLKLFIPVVGALLVLVGIYNLAANGRRGQTAPLPVSDVLRETDSGKITDIFIQGRDITGHFSDGRAFTTYAPYDSTLVDRFLKHDVRITVAPVDDGPASAMAWLLYGFGTLLVWYLIARPLRAAVAILIRIEHILAARAVTAGYAGADRAEAPGGAPTGR